MGENRAPDMVGYHGLDRSENPLAARIAELEAHCVRLGQGDAERYWEARYRDEAAENAHLHAEIARKDEALKGLMAVIEHCDVSEGVCCCGDNMEGHSDPMSCGHTPVDHGQYQANRAHEAARSALSNATTPETGGTP